MLFTKIKSYIGAIWKGNNQTTNHKTSFIISIEQASMYMMNLKTQQATKQAAEKKLNNGMTKNKID